MFRGVGANTNIPRYASIGKLDGHSKRDSVNVCLGVWEVLHGVLSIFKRTFDLPRAASCAKIVVVSSQMCPSALRTLQQLWNTGPSLADNQSRDLTRARKKENSREKIPNENVYDGL